ncbi:MARVEL domain-containing protein [Campylobacter sp. 7477a]|uniref:MARVEL domain-containing protein n=1 Tax=Campylobacter sp. 7477a TaxID=2735741 RepID=UPI0030154659|nr:MARVEL domain-containing protein [Campylobacter sp. 7477a]
MKILENKRGAKLNLLSSLILFCIGGVLYYYYDYRASAIFTMVVSAICVVFCLKKIFQESFILIENDGFVIKKAGRQAKFYFADIKGVYTKIVEKKSGVEILVVSFGRAKFDLELIRGLMYHAGESDASLPNIYEKSIYEIRSIIKEKLENFNSKQA